ncbi:hypothetical protein C8R47DRAFT_1000053 [Mycena vitilis]|nr:hypothetical protein C8R47DRAFT_1000053 [Mycena vitilis]
MHSPFTHLLSSGCPPTASDIPAIRGLILEAETLVTSFDEQIAAMETSLAKLKLDREDTAAFALAHAVLVSAHTYYPVEIICEIFQLFVQSGGDPWVLGQICRRWRTIALDLPVIWSSIKIDLPNSPTDFSPLHTGLRPWHNTLARVATRLKRSAEAPLTIAFRAVRTQMGTALSHYVSTLVESLVGHAERWEHVSLVIYPEQYPLFAPLQGRLSSLETLTLDSLTNEFTDSRLDAFLVAPKLRDVTLIGGMLHIENAIHLPWWQITNYSADLSYNHEHLAVFSMLSSVVEARLTLGNLAPTTHEPRRRVATMERLYVNRGSLLDLDLPVLNELTFEPYDHDPRFQEVPLENLLTFLTQSSPPLTKLCLIGPNFPDALLVRVLQQTPALVDLCIQCRHLKVVELVHLSDVVDFLHAGEDSHLPHLQTLTFGGYEFTDYKKLADMVESRCRGAQQRLESFGLITRHSPDLSQINRRLETLREQGLELVLVDGEGATEALFSLPFFAISYARYESDWSEWQTYVA